MLRPGARCDVTCDVSDTQIAEAIALGKKGIVPIVRVTAFLCDFDIFIQGPVARIAAAAQKATRQFRPFEPANVTAEMAAVVYTIEARQKECGGRVYASRIVLQPRGAEGLDDEFSRFANQASSIEPHCSTRCPRVTSMLWRSRATGRSDIGSSKQTAQRFADRHQSARRLRSGGREAIHSP